MGLTMYGFHGRPHDFAVTKADAPLEECPFFLDFSRKLTRRRRIHWHFGMLGEFAWESKWIGKTVELGVPIVHQSEDTGEFLMSVLCEEPYFTDIQRMWREHYKKPRVTKSEPVAGLKLVADFGTHFPDNC